MYKQKRRHDPSPDPPVVEDLLSKMGPAPKPATKAACSSKVPAAIPVVEISLTSPTCKGAESPPHKIHKFIPLAVGQVCDSKYMSYGMATLIILAGVLQSLHCQRLHHLLCARQATSNNGL